MAYTASPCLKRILWYCFGKVLAVLALQEFRVWGFGASECGLRVTGFRAGLLCHSWVTFYILWVLKANKE